MTQIWKFKDLCDAKAFVQSTRARRDLIVRRIENHVEVMGSQNQALLKVLAIHYSGSCMNNGANQTDN